MDKRTKILLVDKVRLFLEMEKSFFNRQQVEITVARSGAEALRTVRVLRPQLVIMDLNMPDLDGAETCRRLKDDPEFFTTPVILTSDDASPEAMERCRAAGCDAIIAKPLSRQELLLVARRFLELADRATPRTNTRVLVHYGIAAEKTSHDYALNLSTGGLFLETADLLPAGTPLTLEFLIPGVKHMVHCQGQVAWVNARTDKIKPRLPTGFGVRFLDLDHKVAQALRAFIHASCRPNP